MAEGHGVPLEMACQLAWGVSDARGLMRGLHPAQGGQMGTAWCAGVSEEVRFVVGDWAPAGEGSHIPVFNAVVGVSL